MLISTDNKTGNQIQAQQVNTRKDPTQKKWKIRTEEGNNNEIYNAIMSQNAFETKIRQPILKYMLQYKIYFIHVFN